MYVLIPTGVAKRVLPRLRECSRQVEAEVVSNSSNKIHQTWEALFWRPLYWRGKSKERKRNVQWRNTRAGEINYLPHRRPPDQAPSLTSARSMGRMASFHVVLSVSRDSGRKWSVGNGRNVSLALLLPSLSRRAARRFAQKET